MEPRDLTVSFSNGIIAGSGGPVRILDHEGLTSSTAVLNASERAILDGGRVASVRAAMRRLTFDLDFIGTETRWADLGRLFPLGAELELTVTRDGSVRHVTAYRDGEIVALGGRGALDPVACQVSLVSEDAYLRGDDTDLIYAAAITAGLTFPVTFGPISYESMDTGVGTASYQLDNPGDRPVGFVVDFVAAVTTTPTISIGAESMVFDELAAGQRLRVDTTRQTILLDGSNGFPQLISGSFLRIPAGVSTLLLEGFKGATTIEYTPVHEGV